MTSRQYGYGAVQQLTSMGVSLWLDGVDLRQVTSGELARLMADFQITGVTTSGVRPGASIDTEGEGYADVADARTRGLDAATTLRKIDIGDIRRACDLLRPVFDETEGASGYASIDVDPRFADDTAATIADARSLTREIKRPNLLVEIPATHNGLRAIKTCVTDGIHVNVTLIFGLRRYAQVIDAFMDGLERRRAAGGDIRRLMSVASFCLSQVDAEVATRQMNPRVATSLQGRVAVANARLAYRLFQQSLTLPRWTSLVAAGARPQRLRWVATATDDPAIPTQHYVTELAIEDVVVSLPVVSLRALQAMEELTLGWKGEELDARAVLEALATAGVDYDELVLTLEQTAVHNRASAWDAAVEAVKRLGT